MHNYDEFDERLLEAHPHINAFAHFTYQRTKTFMILGIQGKFVQRGNEYVYVLSDPDYVSLEPGTFGPTDFGKAAILNFFKTHKCNMYCEGFNKPEDNGHAVLIQPQELDISYGPTRLMTTN